jgi:uncharacterized protein (TIGR03435 family)
MSDMSDMDLVREFAANNSEAAFAELVQRHVNLVFSVALRFVSNSQDAEDVAQAVFVILAKKAAGMRAGTVLTGWLYETTRFTALQLIRTRTRREHHEEEAHMQSTLDNPNADVVWRQLGPLLEDAMSRLNEKERTLLALRYFENKTGPESAALLGIGEWAVHKRAARALEKLRKYFSRRGVDSTTTIIAETISANSIQIAPVALAKSITAVALAKGATASTSTLTLIKGALKLMAWTKMKTAAVVGIGALLIVGAPTVTMMAVKKSHADAVENYFAHWDKMNLDTATLPDVVVLRPSKYANKGNYVLASSDMSPEGRLMRRGTSFPQILQTAYGFGPEQMVLPANLPRGQFDLLLTVPKSSRELLRAEIKKQYGIVAHPETRDTDVLVLRVAKTNAPGIKISAGGGPNIWTTRDGIKLVGYKVSDPSGYDISHVIGGFYNQPVIDETGLTDAYDVDAKWNGNLSGKALQLEIERVMREQFGLEVVKDRRPVEMLVVERTK